MNEKTDQTKKVKCEVCGKMVPESQTRVHITDRSGKWETLRMCDPCADRDCRNAAMRDLTM